MAENPIAAAVLERCNIYPPPDAAAEITLPLLHFDLTWLYFHPVQRLLFFDFPCSKPYFIETLVPKLKESLAQTLAHFLPLAGNIVHPLNSDRRPVARFVAGDSVSLTIAECDKDFTHLTGNHTRVADDFYGCVPQLPPAKHSSDDVVIPVLALQITLFPDQGVCVGFTNHHAIGDASSIVRFIKAWATVNNSGGDSNLIEAKTLPFYDRTTVEDPELDSIYWNLLRRSDSVESPLTSFPINKVRRTFILTGDDVQKLKHAVAEKRPGIHVTAFTVTCALVWVCLTKAAPEEVADDEPEYIGFAADCRGRLKPPLPAAYFGNCLAFVNGKTTHGLLKGKDGFVIAAERVAEAIQKTVYNEKGILDGAEHWMQDFGKLIGKRLFGVAGSPRFDLYEVDYGWGKPRKFESASIDGDTSMSLSKSRDFEGGLEIGLSRSQEILDEFATLFIESLKKF